MKVKRLSGEEETVGGTKNIINDHKRKEFLRGGRCGWKGRKHYCREGQGVVI